MRRAFLTTILAMLASVAMAQLTGIVTTADGKAAAYATVLLYRDSATNASPMAYAITTTDGHFALQAEHLDDENWIVVRMLGNSEYRRRLGESRSLSIRLESDVQNLDEVMVRSTYMPVQVKGDTVSFDTDYFRTGTEETAAEVLRKLPGIEVGESGEVSFAGKSVDKVLVDGHDIFASGSDGALNTLPADAVRGAELLTNYRSGSLVDQFSGRELTALNLKTDGHHRAAGRIGLSGGLISKGRADGALLYMGQNYSLSATLGANNNGEAVFSMEDYIKTVVGLDNLLSKSGNRFEPSEEELSMLMPPSNVYSSQAGVASASGTWKPNSNLRLKGNLLLNGNGATAASLITQQYSAFEAMQTHSENSHRNSLFGTAHLQETWHPNPLIEVSNLTQMSHSAFGTADSIAESGLTTMFASQQDNLEKWQLNEEMAVNIKPSNKTLLSAHVGLHSQRRNYSNILLTDNELLPPVVYQQQADGNFMFDTRRNIYDRSISPDISFAINFSHGMTLAATAAFDYRHNMLAYNENPESAAGVDASIAWNSASGGLHLSKQYGLLRFNLGADLVRTAWTSPIDGLTDSNTLYLQPSATVSLVFSETHRLSLSASTNRKPIELEYLLRDTIVNSYNALMTGSDIVVPFSRSKEVQLQYFLLDLYSNTMFFLMAGASENIFAVRPHHTQDSSIASLIHYNNDGRMAIRFATTSLRKGLGDLPCDLTMAANITQSNTTTELNGTENLMATLAYGGSIGLSSRSKGALNAAAGFSYNGSQNDISDGRSSTYAEVAAHAAIMVTWRGLTAKAQIAYSRADDDENPRNLYDLGLRAEYRLGKWRTTLRGGNLLHLHSQEWMQSSATPLYLYTSVYRRLPGYLMAGAAYTF